MCISSANDKKTHKANFGRAQRLWLLKSQLLSRGHTVESLKQLGLPVDDSYEPCADDYTTTYLNRADVKAAIHAPLTAKWNSCSNTLSYNSTDSSVVSTAPIYNYLINGGFGLDILVFSGDDDSVCATIGTQDWVNCLVILHSFDFFIHLVTFRLDLGFGLPCCQPMANLLCERPNRWVPHPMEEHKGTH